jgi:hypothetical protein
MNLERTPVLAFNAAEHGNTGIVIQSKEDAGGL